MLVRLAWTVPPASACKLALGATPAQPCNPRRFAALREIRGCRCWKGRPLLHRLIYPGRQCRRGCRGRPLLHRYPLLPRRQYWPGKVNFRWPGRQSRGTIICSPLLGGFYANKFLLLLPAAGSSFLEPSGVNFYSMNGISLYSSTCI